MLYSQVASLVSLSSGVEYAFCPAESNWQQLLPQGKTLKVKSLALSVFGVSSSGAALDVDFQIKRYKSTNTVYRGMLGAHLYAGSVAGSVVSDRLTISINPDVVLMPGEYLSITKTVTSHGGSGGYATAILEVVDIPEEFPAKMDYAEERKQCGPIARLIGAC